MDLKSPPLSCGELEPTHLSYLRELYVKDGKKGKCNKIGCDSFFAIIAWV